MTEIANHITAASIFNNHYNYYKEIGVETIMQQAGQLEQVGSDYQGRIIYELLQNAFDKAESKILVLVINNTLLVANDGIKFNYASNFDYLNGDSKRGDFQSLCSISTSTKDRDSSIGNKGVGFKSVFSIAEYGYVNIYTKGSIISGEKNLAEVNLDFRMYEMFKDVNKIQPEFDTSIRDCIAEKINFVQKERKDRGVPGFYFPLQIQTRPVRVDKLMEEGYVTVIEVPFTSAEEKTVLELLEEIKGVHFQFIQLKHPKNIVVKFQASDIEHQIAVDNNDRPLFVGHIKKDLLQPFADAAGIHIEDAKVAFYINKDKKGVLYNYLPTKVNSPFTNIDFHADFHTTVDRKSINFEGKIGAYNKTLLNACIELYFVALNSYLDSDKRVELDTRLISENELNVKLDDFNWEYLSLNNTDEIFDTVRNILKIWNSNSYSDGYGYSYEIAGEFIAKLASKFFGKQQDKKEYDTFYLILEKFISKFAKRSLQYDFWKDLFKDKIVYWLRQYNAKIIPNIGALNASELLYRSSSKDDLVRLPDFMNIKITDYKVNDIYIREKLGIKEFNDFNEVLKFFKQCTQAGEINEDRISESDQTQILQSIYQIFSSKKSQQYLSTHRFSKIYNSEVRRTNSALNQANFAISTIFLKLLNGKYKPAQLCVFNELDIQFLPVCKEDELKEFLKYLGVSMYSDYIFADKRLWQLFKDGSDFIPGLILKYQYPEDISEKMLQYIHIIKQSGSAIHPALINNGGEYKFLYNVNSKEIRYELENLFVKNYALFPTSYCDLLRIRMQESFNSVDAIIKLYQIVFTKYVYDNHFLIIENDKLSWTDKINFYVVTNRKDFDNCIQFPDRKILCYYSYNNLPPQLANRICNQKSGDVEAKGTSENYELKKSLDQKMIYLLLNISLSKLTDLNYLQSDKSASELQEKFRKLLFIESTQLKQQLVYDNLGSLLIDKEYAIDPKKDGFIYLKKSSKKSVQSLAIGEYLFNNRSVKESIELILFHKDLLLLKEESDEEALSIIRKKWKADYTEKFKLFQEVILKQFQCESKITENWNIYNECHINPLLIEIDKNGKIQELVQIIEKTKILDEFDGYFDDFFLLIDASHIIRQAAALILFLESQSEINFDLIQEIKNLSRRLGVEDELIELENKIKEIYKKEILVLKEDKKEKEKELGLENKIDIVCYNLNMNPKSHHYIDLNGVSVTEVIKYDQAKTIYQSNEIGETSKELTDLTGVTGEEQVLGYYIGKFIQLDEEERKKGIQLVYDLLVNKVGNESHKKYKDECLANLKNDVGLKKALIPFFYVTLHYKFSYFDLVVYKNGKATMVEVKTTLKAENNTFNLPLTEINAARGDDEYEIVRVTPNSIYFIGNPIKQVEENIALIKTDKFQLIPKSYEFTFF